MVERFKKIDLIKDYIEAKLAGTEQWNTECNVGVENPFNGRQLTNVGTFRAYIETYLRNHEMIHEEEMTFLVRQLAPDPTGLPLEIYAFTKTVDWIEYEAIQADIFGHLVAAASQFDLRVFQEPTGVDFQALAASK
jgi:miniconductance mechanosensitive channel